MQAARIIPSLLATALVVLLPFGSPRAANGVSLPDRNEAEDALPEGSALGGRVIFDRFLEIRLHSAVQYQTVFSRDPGGNEQRSQFRVRWKDYLDADKKAVDGVLAKTLVKFEAPDDIAWKNVEDAEYERLPDETIDGTPVYVVEVTVKPFVESQYKTRRTWIE